MATCIVGLSGAEIIFVSDMAGFTDLEVRQYHMDYQSGDEEYLVEDAYGVYEIVHPPRVVPSGATHYSLNRFLITPEVTDGKRWYEEPIIASGDDEAHGFSVFGSLAAAIEGARIELSDRERLGDTRWEPRVNVVGHDGDPRGDAEGNEVSGWSEGWVDDNGEFFEGDYENDERIYGPPSPTYEEYQEAKEAIKAEWDIAAADLPDGAGDALDAGINAAHQVIEAYERQHNS